MTDRPTSNPKSEASCLEQGAQSVIRVTKMQPRFYAFILIFIRKFLCTPKNVGHFHKIKYPNALSAIWLPIPPDLSSLN